MACEYKYKGEWYTMDELLNHPDFKTAYATQQRERAYVLSDTGPNTEEQINMFAPNVGMMGIFPKYVAFKRSQLREYRQRLKDIEQAKRRKGVTVAQMTDLKNQEREIKLEIDGKFELGIKGLVHEIQELESLQTSNAVGPYVDKDLKRLDKLSQSLNIEDLREAERLIDFYVLAGTFQLGIENPFFSQDEIFLADLQGNLTPQYRLSQVIRDQFTTWANQAVYFQNIIRERKKAITMNAVNGNNLVQRTYGAGNKMEFGTIMSEEMGLRDTDFLSMWVMDITQGIFSTNGILPQVMFSYLNDSLEQKLKWARDIAEKIDKINPGVQKELMRLGYTLRGAGILGIKGASYNMFKEITKEGNETGGIKQRFSKEFYDAQSRANSKFSDDFDQALANPNPTHRANEINRAHEELKRWRRQNTIIMDINRVPELAGSSPVNDAYKTELVALLGNIGYAEQLERQKDLLDRYESEKQSIIDTLLLLEGKASFADLSVKAQNDFNYWENNHDPKKGIEDYYTQTGIFFGGRKAHNFMNYNNLIPRKYKVNIAVNSGQYTFSDTTDLTDHFTADFNVIEDNPILKEFYDTVKEVVDAVRENMPYELQRQVAVNTVPALLQSASEIIADKNNGPLSAVFLAYRNLMDRIRLSFGIVKQSEISYATIDPITGRTSYKVNDQFLQGNIKAVKERRAIESAKFIQAFNSGRKAGTISQIKRHAAIELKRFNVPALIELAKYLNVDISIDDIQAGRIDPIKNITGDMVQIGKYMRDFSMHTVVQSQSFDLGKIAKYFANMTMAYAARQESLPILEIMKQHYEQIRKPKTNNLGRGIFNPNEDTYLMDGLRTNAMKQMDDWFERVVLDNYGTKHLFPHGNNIGAKKRRKIEKRLKAIETELTTATPQQTKDLIAEREKLLIRLNTPGYGKTIYSTEDKKKLGEIENLLLTENDPGRIEELTRIKERLGKARTATAFFDNMWAFIRTMRLGYNLSSGITNFIEGVTSNMIIASSGDYFDPKEVYYGYSVMKYSFLKNISFGSLEFGESRKNRKLMDKFNVIMDSKNELQKSSIKTHANRVSWMNPHELNQRVEFMNQSPIMIAMLRTIKIRDKSGNESTVWEAMTKDGHLKAEFQTPENVENWEDLSGKDYLAFKQKLHKAIVLGHGNYHDLRGMMIKSNTAGKALMMFKTWIPMQIYWRFAVEQDDIQTGKQGFRGRYWSYGKGAFGLHTAVLGLAAFGPWGALVGVGGYLAGKYFGTDPGVGLLQETLVTTKAIFKKMIGMPVNLAISVIPNGNKLMRGQQVLGSDNDFQKWVLQGNITENDARNLRSNITDISLQLTWLALILLVKGLLWDDDDEKDSPERIAHNIMINRLMTLSSQGTMYVNPVDLYNSTIGKNAVIGYIEDVSKEITKLTEMLGGRDIIRSGHNAGESGLWNQTKKAFLPGVFKDKLFGFETQAERVFEESPWHHMFKSEKTQDKEANQRDRAGRRLELKELGYEDKEIRKILDDELPTPTRLKKLGVTRDEYYENRGEVPPVTAEDVDEPVEEQP